MEYVVELNRLISHEMEGSCRLWDKRVKRRNEKRTKTSRA